MLDAAGKKPHWLSPLLRHVALREWCVILAVMLSLASALGFQNGLGRVDQTLYDQFLTNSSRPARDDIIIVAIDEFSLAELGRWPWPRGLHADVIRKIASANPRMIGLDVILSEPEGPRGLSHESGDLAMAKVLQDNRRTVLPFVLANAGRGITALLPIETLAKSARSVAHIHLEHDSDGVVRSVFLREGQNGKWWPHFALALFNPEAKPLLPDPGDDVSQRIPASALADSPQSSWQRANQVHIAFAGNNGHFQSVPYVAVLRGEVPDQFFAGKYVLIGATARGMTDSYPTPVSGNSGAMPGIEINANILAGLLDGKSIVIAKPWQTMLFTITPVFVALLACLVLQPRAGLVICGVLLVVTAGVSFMALRGGLWVPPSAALLTMAISYPLWSWRRLEAAIAYLGQEFIRLDHEPHLLPEAPAIHDLEQIDDVLERRINAMTNASHRVRDLRQFVSDSLDNLPDATMVTDTDGRVVLANKAAHLYFRSLDIRQVAQASIFDLLSRLIDPQPIDGSANMEFDWHGLLDPGCVDALVNGVEARDENGRDLLVKSAPCHSASDVFTGWIVSVVDISTIRAAERSRDETLRFLSHDMRAPQSSILALLELQSEGSSALPQKEFFSRIEKASRRTLGLADNFVQLARAESHEYRLEEVDFQDVLFDATDEMWMLAKNKNITLVTDIADGEFAVHIDRALITRALVNLISNAIHYSPEGTTITCTVTRHPGLHAEQIVCSIRDQGYGIEAADQAKLFRRFQRVNVPGQPRHDGIGLGLVFVRTVIERHQGHITFSSEVDVGTVFTFVLPSCQTSEAA